MKKPQSLIIIKMNVVKTDSQYSYDTVQYNQNILKTVIFTISQDHLWLSVFNMK